MKFMPLCAVQLMHPYYTDGRCSDFDLEPTLATKRLLAHARCVLKEMPHGIRILTAVTASDAPFMRLSPGATLTFHFRLNNPDFVLFTNLPDDYRTTGTVYTNADPHVNDRSSANDRSSISLTPRQVPRTALAPDVFVAVEICDNASFSLTPAAACVFDVIFSTRQARWIYYVITNPHRAESTWQIMDTAPSPDSRVMFDVTNRTDLVLRPDPTDAIATWLAAQYPTMQRWRFVSDAAIPSQQTPRQYLELVYNGQTVWETLPNPTLHHYTTTVVNSNGMSQAQDALYHILTDFT